MKLLITLTLTIIFMSAVACCNEAMAAELSWVNPTEREDNTPISIDEIAGYRVYYGQGEDLQNQIDIEGARTSYTADFPKGVEITAVITVIDTDGRESVYSNPMVFTVPKLRPKAATGFNVIP